MNDHRPENLYEQLVENAGDIIAVLNASGIITFVNSRVGAYPGLSVGAIIGHPFSELIHHDDQARCSDAISQVFAGKAVSDFHCRATLPDGSIRHLVVNAGLRLLGGEEALLAVCRDTTESIGLSEQLLARNRALSALTEMAVALAGPDGLDDKLRVALDRTLAMLGMQTGAIVMKDETGKLRVSASTVDNLEDMSKIAKAEGELVSELCMQRNELTIVPDMDGDGVPPAARDLGRELGIEAFVAMPLQCGRRMRAALSFAVPKQFELSLEQMEFLRLAAGILGPAIENAKLHSDLADRANRLAMLERLAKSTNTERDVDTVLKACMREIAGLVEYDLGVVVLLKEDGEAEVFPFSSGGVAQPSKRMELGSEQMSHIKTIARPMVFGYDGTSIPFHTRPETFQPDGGSGVAAPLMCKGRMFGLLKVWSSQSDKYAARENEILEAAAEHLSIAAYNAGLYEAEQRKSLQLSASAKETQHRIRNNLQVVSGLLEVSLNSPEVGRRSVERCLRQVRAIATVHDLLSPDDMSARIRLSDCLGKIATNALRATGRSDCVDLVVSGDCCMVTADVATAVGVIVNELVSNSVEHGFRGVDKGQIQIRVCHEEKQCTVDVIDDGIGVPEGFTLPETPNSAAGLGLMSSLAEYGLGGTLDIERLERGTRARVSLKGV